METIVFKAPDGTKARLRDLGGISKLLREQVARLFEAKQENSAFSKCSHLAGSVKSLKRGAKGNDYLNQYAKKNNR